MSLSNCPCWIIPVDLTLLSPSGHFDPIQCLILLLPLYLLTYFTLGVNMTPSIKISRKLLEIIFFSKFKCEVLYVYLLTTERTPTLNIELGQIDPKATGGLNIESGQNDPKAT